MLTINQINAMTDSVVDIMRKARSMKGMPTPDYHNTYLQSVEMKEAIEIHAVPGRKPDKLVAERAPNQTDQEFKYVMANYQQTTMAVFLDAVHTMQRAFSDNNWSIDYRQGEDEENELQQYLETDIRDTDLKLTFEGYMFQVVPSLKMIDAMGCIAVKPWEIPTVTTPEGEVLIDSERMFEPTPQYYPSESIMAYEEGRFYFFLSEKKSQVEYGNKMVNEGLIFDVYDDQNIYQVIQVGKLIDYDFKVLVYHNHELGYCPVTRLMGIPANYNGEVIFQSLFLYAVPSLNDVIIDNIMLRSVKAASVFPYRVMTANICTNTITINGEIQNCDGTGWFRDFTTNQSICCPTCMGTGMRDRISPHGVLLLRPETAFKEGELKSSQPAMYYVEPSINTPQFIRSEIETNTNRARNILHLRDSDSQVKGAADLTATGMVLDEKSLYSTVKMFSDQTFDIFEFCMNTIGRMRYGQSFEMPVVTRSITFDFATEYEYMERISLAIKNGLPSFVVQEIVFRYIKTMFYNESERAQIFDLLITTDLLLVTPDEQINIEVGQGIVAPWQVVLHNSGVTLIKQMIERNPSYLDQDMEVQREQLIEEATRIADENKPVTTVSPGSAVQRALDIANAGTI